MDIVTLGELIVDMFPAELGRKHSEVSAYRPVPGGAPANAAVAAARLGARAAFVGKVGDDPFGEWMTDVLKREGVDTRGVRVDPHARTTLNIMAQPDADHYDCLFYRNPGADTLLRPDELDADLLGDTRAFHFGSISLTDEPSRSAALEAAAIARRGGAIVSFDVNYRPTLWGRPEEALEQVRATVSLVDVLKVNEGELSLLTGRELSLDPAGWEDRVVETARTLLALGPSLIIVTLGPNGAFYVTPNSSGQVSGFNVKTVDATGCGDAFIAGLVWQLVKGNFGTPSAAPGLLADALRYANAVGALTATKQGVFTALPTAAEVSAFLRARA